MRECVRLATVGPAFHLLEPARGVPEPLAQALCSPDAFEIGLGRFYRMHQIPGGTPGFHTCSIMFIVFIGFWRRLNGFTAVVDGFKVSAFLQEVIRLLEASDFAPDDRYPHLSALLR